MEGTTYAISIAHPPTAHHPSCLGAEEEGPKAARQGGVPGGKEEVCVELKGPRKLVHQLEEALEKLARTGTEKLVEKARVREKQRGRGEWWGNATRKPTDENDHG